MCGVSGRSLVFPAPRASGRGSPGRLLPTLAMRPGLTPTFDGSGQEPPGITGAAPGGRAPATGLPGVMEAAPPRRPGPAASGWPKPSKVGAGAASRRRPRPKPSKVGVERAGGARGGCRSRRRPHCAIGCGIPAERTAAFLEGMATRQHAGALAARRGVCGDTGNLASSCSPFCKLTCHGKGSERGPYARSGCEAALTGYSMSLEASTLRTYHCVRRPRGSRKNKPMSRAGMKKRSRATQWTKKSYW